MEKKGLSLLLAVVMGLVLGSGALAQVQTVITYQGRLTDAGGPANGNFDMTFRIFDAATGGNLLWVETFTGLPVTAGLFTVVLGQQTPIQFIFTGSPLRDRGAGVPAHAEASADRGARSHLLVPRRLGDRLQR